MSDDFDADLRRALRAVEPPAGFTERVMRRLASQQIEGAPLHRAPHAWRVPVGLAAAVLLGLGGVYVLQQQRQEHAGLEARREVIEALRLTDQKLDLAYQTVKDASGT